MLVVISHWNKNTRKKGRLGSKGGEEIMNLVAQLMNWNTHGISKQTFQEAGDFADLSFGMKIVDVTDIILPAICKN